MIQFKALRLSGFKSFVDRTTLDIGPGLSGIVGPNGCGKSNLVEAMRWVMGESSAKRMRGGAMEDVIFNGSAQRTKRNIAEVSLLLDNSTRSAPAAYNSSDEIEITRKIERDRGSNYKINGRPVRARDVQMLFADTVTGANSPALVSQGRVTEMISAKPLDRRLVLEESAGISGLFARRHEAELRLRAADNNLVRLDDITGSMEGRLNSLKRQARQANAYRNFSAQIRQMEILIASMEWQALVEKITALRQSFESAESRVAERLQVVTQLTATQSTQARDIPALREDEARAAAALQAQKLALQRIEDEAAHDEKLLSDTQDQMAQADTDYAHAQSELEENMQGLERIESETATIQTEQNSSEARLAEKLQVRDDLSDEVLKLDTRTNALIQSVAEGRAQKDAISKRLESNTARLDILQVRQSENEEELQVLLSHAPDDSSDYKTDIGVLESKTEALQDKVLKTQAQLKTMEPDIEAARGDLKECEANTSELLAKINMLEGFLKEENEGQFSPVLDDILPHSGFEKALSRALGDSLMASLDSGAASAWLSPQTSREALADLPKDVTPLLPHVKAPKILHVALSQIGLADDDEAGDSLWERLKPGQALVSKAGTYWRWDGYRIKAEAIDRRAQHLEQKNKLEALNVEKPKVEALAAKARVALYKILTKQQDLQSSEQKDSALRASTEQNLTEKRASWAALREERTRIESHSERLQETALTAKVDIEALEALIHEDTIQLEAYETGIQDDKDAELERLKETLSEARQAHSDAIRAFDLIQQQQNTRQARLHAIADERINLKNRSIRARERLKALEERKATLSERLEELSDKPSDFSDQSEMLLAAISKLGVKRDEAAEKLAVCEAALADTARALKEAEGELGEVREARAHAQATFAALQEQRDLMQATLEEKFEMPPDRLAQHVAIDMDKEWDDLESLRRRKEGFIRDRDAIGPVNLRAEGEAAELETEFGTMLSERQDLVQAIEELRSGIQSINKEARARLVAAFEHVNGHFKRLFAQLFDGGEAHLALIDSDDPLLSGLEIFAQPPGKSLQSLSLLSGGEQTLASIALIFAMFLTNPSPICVLDEIDAPLDDTNVDRVCNLLEDIAARGETRFLVITHHRLTMARMDRLYGVTMAEQGLSQLVSVDLQQSFEFLEAA